MRKEAQWIWADGAAAADEYVYFFESVRGAGDTSLSVACDGDYAVYVNGALAACGQYADYPHYKVYDRVDVTAFMKEGENQIVFLAWHIGADCFTYTKGKAGLIYALERAGAALAVSRAGVPCRYAKDYANHRCKNITVQMGLGYAYDTRFAASSRLPSGEDVRPAVTVEGAPQVLHPRPVKKLVLKPETTMGSPVAGKPFLYDCGREVSGFLHIRFKAAAGVKVTVAYGEHIADGGVRRCIGVRDFSVELTANGAWTEFLNTFRRFGCRYLQVESDGEAEVEFIGIRETEYPLNVLPFTADTPLRQRIYDTAVRTLHLCMHEHYEDTPWREQSMYVMDSRNQMLCGYYAFKEYAFPRAALNLMAKGLKSDGLLPLCTPAGLDVPIPFFSLMYTVALKEYGAYSGDWDFVREVLPVAESIVQTFLNRVGKDGLVAEMEGYWNFYEWSEGLDGVTPAGFISEKQTERRALPLNCFLLYALTHMEAIYAALGIDKAFTAQSAALREGIYRTFFDAEKGLFKSFDDETPHYAALPNALAVLTGCAKGREKHICAALAAKSGLIEATLSMKIFEYDALLRTDPAYAGHILNEIDTVYGYMLDSGATSFWETIKGEKDFDNAGSLCHGWSAIPVYYYHLFQRR